jgi:hypothetical protein
LLADWSGTPNAPGAVVKAALAGYHDPSFDGTKVNTQPGDAGVTPATDAGGPRTSDASSQ